MSHPAGHRRVARRLLAALTVAVLLAAVATLTGTTSGEAAARQGSSAPIGHLDRVTVSDGVAVVAGWALDPDTTASIDVHVYVDGVFARGSVAALRRVDVAAAYPGYGPDKGFALRVEVGPGSHEVCVWALDHAGGENRRIGCRWVTDSPYPIGHLDRVTVVGESAVVVAGWALDPDTTASIDVHVYVDGVFARGSVAALRRVDVAAAYPGYGPDKGFALRVEVGPGSHEVCVWALDHAGGENRRIGCRQVIVGSVLPGSLVVAYYGSGLDPRLGVLGHRSPADSARAVVERARSWEGFGLPVVPAFEYIASVATAAPGPGGDYSFRSDPATIRPWLEAIRAVGGVMVIDIQPGQSDFLTEVSRYEELLVEPDVWLALDPEWRMPPGVAPGTRIGSVDASELNRVTDYVAGLVRTHGLPVKPVIIHQFDASMITNRDQLIARDELAIVIHLDGFGTPELKAGVYSRLHVEPPFLNGFKLFFDQDSRLMTPHEVMTVLDPAPVFVSYQ